MASTGVQRVTVDEDSAGQRLDNYLLKRLKGVPKTHVYRIVRSGEVRVNGARASADTRLQGGDELRLPPLRVAQRDAPAEHAPPQEFPLLYEDDMLLAIDKPAGVAVHGGSGVSFGVIEQLRRARPHASFLELVHRLDKETSGILLLAKRRSALTALQQQFRGRDIGKRYAALVVGGWPAACKVIDVPLQRFLTAEGERRVRAGAAAAGAGNGESAQRAISLVHIVQRFAAFTLLDVTIKTGRTHQIRVHLAHEGHGIVGDEKYGAFALNKALAKGEPVEGVQPGPKFSRMFLHARELRFRHPASGDELLLSAPLPADCEQLLERLKPA